MFNNKLSLTSCSWTHLPLVSLPAHLPCWTLPLNCQSTHWFQLVRDPNPILCLVSRRLLSIVSHLIQFILSLIHLWSTTCLFNLPLPQKSADTLICWFFVPTIPIVIDLMVFLEQPPLGMANGPDDLLGTPDTCRARLGWVVPGTPRLGPCPSWGCRHGPSWGHRCREHGAAHPGRAVRGTRLFFLKAVYSRYWGFLYFFYRAPPTAIIVVGVILAFIFWQIFPQQSKWPLGVTIFICKKKRFFLYK